METRAAGNETATPRAAHLLETVPRPAHKNFKEPPYCALRTGGPVVFFTCDSDIEPTNTVGSDRLGYVYALRP